MTAPHRGIDTTANLALGLAGIAALALIVLTVWASPEAFRVNCISTTDHSSRCQTRGK